MSFPAFEVLSEYRGLAGLPRSERPSIILRGSAMVRMRQTEFMLLRVAEWDQEPPSYWDLKRPIEALEEERTSREAVLDGLSGGAQR